MAALEEWDEICRKFQVNSLSNHQIAAIKGIKEQKDVFVGTKTGSGKSLIYECTPIWLDEEACIIIVIAPLLSIMKEQTERLNALGFRATFIGKDSSENPGIHCGRYQFVFASPEKLLGELQWRNMLLSDIYRRQLRLIVVDEAHTVVQWGEDKIGEAAFRKSFSEIGQLRSLVCKATILALTATASPANRKAIMKSLVFRTNSITVIDSPDRHNIKISCHMVSNTASTTDIFQWLLQDLQVKHRNLQRHLIFCKSIRDCSSVYSVFTKKFGKDCNLFNMFHSMTPEVVKEEIRNDMNSSTGHIRILVCTNAAGMGVNFRSLYQVIHLGPPNDLDTFLQQMGRAGRDGVQSHELCIFRMHKGHLKDVEPEMVHLLRSDKCRRKIISDAYMSQLPTLTPHACCDVCANDCDCTENLCPMEHAIKRFEPEVSDDERVRRVSHDQRNLLESKLLALKFKLTTTEEVSMVPDELLHGFTTAVMLQIIDNVSTIFSAKDVMQKAAVWSFDIAVMVINVIDSVFGDVDSLSEDSDE